MAQWAGGAGQMVEQATDGLRGTVREASPWVTWLGRFGFVCKGLVYLLIGVLAGQAALGRGGATTDAQGALSRMLEAPFGQVLIGLIGIGFLGYAMWRFVQAALDTEGKGADAKGLCVRAGYVVSGAIHTILAVSALRLVQGDSGGQGGDQSAQDGAARLLEQPFGQVFIVLLGLGLAGAAAFQGLRAFKADFRKKLRAGEMSARETEFATKTGRLGYAARGVTFGTMSLFLLLAAVRHEPGEAKGLAGSLAALLEQAYGPMLLAIVAAGLIAYGLYMFVEARYRRMRMRE